MRARAALLVVAALAGAQERDAEARFVDALRAGAAEGSGARVVALVAPEAREVLGPAALDPIFDALRKKGSVRGVERDPATPWRAGERVRFRILHGVSETFVDAYFDVHGRITGIWFRPRPPRSTLEALHRRMRAWKGDFAYRRVVLDPTGRVAAEDALGRGREAFPIGSIFKLYVLAEVARRASAGEIDLERKLALREELKSLPSGRLQDEPAGRELTVAELAREMIAISDNTATDHLLDLVGRANVEARLAQYRNSFPDRNTPFLSTREMFLMKGAGRSREIGGRDLAGLADAWAAGDPAFRRGVLAKLVRACEGVRLPLAAPLLGMGYQAQTLFEPRHVEIEWFARPADIVDLLLDAHRGRLVDAGTSAIFRRFLAAGPAFYPAEGLAYYGAKGGSENHVFALSALAASRDGRVVAVCLCRCGFSPADQEVAGAAVEAVSSLLRLGLEEGR